VISVLSETRYSSLADHILSAVFAFVIFLVFASDQLFMTLEFAYSTTSSPVEAVSPPSRHSGPIVSLQFSSDGTPMWIVSGRWKIDVNYDTTGEMPLSIKNLNVSLVMVSVDGTTTHRYKLSNLEQNSLSYDNATNTSTLRGTLKLTLEGKSIDQLDTSLKIINKKIIVISLDSSKTNSYFGETPIYGLDR
jgi:hypothetical protein